MSYEIVKSIKVVKDEDNKFYAEVTSASNNVHPRYYSTWQFKKITYVTNEETGKRERVVESYETKEELEKEILLDFYNGNLQKGSNKYNKVVQAISLNKDLFKQVSRVSKLRDKAFNHKHKLLTRANGVKTTRYEELEALRDKLRELEHNLVKEALYTLMQNTNSQKISFIIKSRHDNYYVCKVNSRSYRSSLTPHVFTSPSLYERVTSHEWWENNFIVTKVS